MARGPLAATWGAGAAALAALMALVVGFILAIPAFLFDGSAETGELGTNALVGAQLATAIGFLVVPFWLASRPGGGLVAAARRLGLRRFDSSAWGWAAVAAVAYFTFVIIYATLIINPEQEDIASSFGAVPIQFFLIVICASLSEEICFRGMLFGGFRGRFGRVGAALGAALLFGLLHVTTGVTAVVPLIAFGFILALLYEKTGSLWPSILLHAANNSLALWALQAG